MPPSIIQFSDMNDGGINLTTPEPISVITTPLKKRKRPPMIEIPNTAQTADSDAVRFMQRDVESKSNGGFSSSGFGVGVCSVKGRKSFMEDTHTIVSSSNTDKVFFGVFDGHGGSKAAEFVAKNLHSNVFELLEKCSENTTTEEIVKAAFMKTDDEFLKQGVESGACCVTALIKEKELFVSNLGDCRAVISRKGKAESLTKDHKASHDDERKRIQDKGGYVELHRGTWRVHGVLAVSRSIGDAHLKDWVLGEPETKILPLTDDLEYLVLASDGLWDEVGNQEAIDVVTRCMENHSPKLKKFCRVKRMKQRVKNNWKESENYFTSENDEPQPKARRVLSSAKTRAQNQDQYHGWTADGLVDTCKECVNLALKRGSLTDEPQHKAIREVSLLNQDKSRTQDQEQNQNQNQNQNQDQDHGLTADGLVDACKELVNLAVKRGSLTDEPQHKDILGFSLLNQDQSRAQDQNQNQDQDHGLTANGLVDACKELVNLAVKRGSLDDITVMILDLKSFQ